MTHRDDSALLELANQALDHAKSAGADAADVVVVSGSALSSKVRLGKLEGVERSEDCDLGIRVFSGKSHAIVATSELDETSLKDAAMRCLERAKAAPEDPFAGLADEAASPAAAADLDLFDSHAPSASDLEAFLYRFGPFATGNDLMATAQCQLVPT